MAFWSWSRTAASNATADGTINWAEGQAPSSVNDSARAMMARLAEWRDDVNGATVTGGTGAAYTLTTFEGVSSPPATGQMLAFRCNATNVAGATLAADGGTAYGLYTSDTAPVDGGVLIGGASYRVLFDGARWLLQGFYGSNYNVPLGGGMPYFGSTVPNSAFAFANGAAISRTTYATLFALVGTTYGAGDGSTTFNLPDLSGRVPAGKEAVASRLTSSYFGGDSTALGSPGGGESKTLVTANLPPYTPAGGLAGASSGTDTILVNGNSGQSLGGGTTGFGWSNSPTVKAIAAALSWAGTFTGAAQGGSSTPIRTVQPTLICNYIIRII